MVAWADRTKEAAFALGRDRRGVAAVEMALLSPLLVLLFLGTIEVTQLVRVEGKLTRAAEAMQDMVAVETGGTTSHAQLLAFFSGGQQIMTPFTTTGMSAAIADVRFNAQQAPVQIIWQDLENGAGNISATTACAAATGMSLGSDDVIMVQVTYTYVPIVSYLFGNKFTLSQTAYGRPRANPAQLNWSGSPNYNGSAPSC